jgi:hypothetical protein
MTGGILEDCRVENNIAGSGIRTSGLGGGIYMTGGTGIACNVVGNTQYGSGGGVYMTGGILRNSLVVSNSAPSTGKNGGGLYLAGAGARVENCTVSDNGAPLGTGNGIYQVAGSVTNSIILFNTAVPNVVQTGGSIGFSSMDPLISGTGNTNADPFFVTGSYRPGAGSKCIDTGTNLAWTLTGTDLDGSNRVANSIVDMGAYESPAASAEDPLGCNFDAAPTEGPLSLTPVFSAYATGGNTNILWYRWEYGDGVTEQGAELATTSHAYGPGWYTVTLTVRNTDEDEASSVRTALIKVAPETAYVAKNASNIPPYLTWGNAASNVEDAVDAGPVNVLVSNGTYNSTKTILVTRDMTIRSINGPAVTVINAGNVSFRRVVHVQPQATNAWIQGFTLYGGEYGSYSDGGAGVLLENGTVTNCWITQCVNYTMGAGAWVKNGLLVGSRIYGNRSGAALGTAVGVYLTGGIVRDCVIYTNRTYAGGGNVTGAGVYMTAGLLDRCTVTGNVAGTAGNTNSPGGGIYMSGGTAVACRVSANTAYGAGGGVYMTGGTLRNSLVISNSVPLNSGGGLYLAGAGARVENCTVSGNNATVGNGRGLYLAAGSVTNSIIQLNTATPDVYQTGGTIGFSSMDPVVAGEGNTNAYPYFVAGSYQIGPASRCMNSGTNLAWTLTGTDIDGSKRVINGSVDMGAYEMPNPSGSVILFR